ncbi:hypothetical protein EVAR_54943_1 [Eumeta japonica]|uniref:Uncharacterized protein n=1 Tax=Eumeta variegata TaxID=151549 RepID=A0A4C1YP66_EUMVA|nr:hypothetical protein EVAR_54943_1 [Eumeta japonica]
MRAAAIFLCKTRKPHDRRPSYRRLELYVVCAQRQKCNDAANRTPSAIATVSSQIDSGVSESVSIYRSLIDLDIYSSALLNTVSRSSCGLTGRTSCRSHSSRSVDVNDFIARSLL